MTDVVPPNDPRTDLARRFVEALPFSAALGLRLVAAGPGRAEVDLPWDDGLVGDAESGVIHGGAVFALMDTCAGTAVFAHPDAPAATATLGLRIDYFRAAHPGQAIRAVAEVVHMGRSVAFVRASAADADGAFATATGTFTAERGGPRREA